MASSVRDIDKGYKALLQRLGAAAAHLTVGVHETEGGAAKDEASGDGLTVLDVAGFHEFGLGVPRRSFIADWADENESRHRAQLAAMARAVALGTVASAEIGVARLGNLYVGEVQKRIADGIQPALSPRTIKRKGSSVALINTGQLRSSIAFYVNGVPSK